MKTLTKISVVALGLISASAFALGGMPSEIYKPAGAQVVKVDRKGGGEYEAEFRLRGNDARDLAKRVISHARSQAFHVVESGIERDDVDLKFERGDQELDVQIEVKDHGRIEYKADLDLDKN